MPRVINADVPSGNTSQSLTLTWPYGRSLRTRIVTDAVAERPRGQRRSASRRPTTWRCRLAGRAADPTAARRRTSSRPATPTSPRTSRRSTPFGRHRPRPHVAGPAGGHVVEVAPHAGVGRRGLAAARPGGGRRPAPCSPPTVARRGGVRRRRRGSRGCRRCSGPGRARSGLRCDHGPAIIRHGRPLRSYCSIDAERVVAVAVGPPGDEHRRARHPLVAGAVGSEANRAAPPRRAVERMGQPLEQPRWRRLDALPPLVAPAVAGDRRHGRQGVHRHHVQRVVDEVDRPQHAAGPVHVVGVAVVGGVHRHDRAECAGPPSAAICSELNPEYDVPNIPTRPRRPWLRRQPLDRPDGGRAVRRRDTRRSSRPPDDPVPRRSSRSTANPAST